MFETVGLHLWRLCALFVLGTALEVVFEMYSALRAAFRLPKTVQSIADVLVASLSFSGLVVSLFFINGAELRLYVAVGLGAGFATTRYSVGKPLSRFFRRIFGLAARGISWIHRRSGSSLGTAVNSIRTLVKKFTSWFALPA
ncbi:MAG: spore cortex biosynthesis protein YabQ [Firmicutes bacterium]|nr:spore cortex biosynthesis protein YabQ [Candidatus Fermentithermobacillaceae bacterium]